MLKTIIGILFLSTVISGCSLTGKTEVIEAPKTIMHPEWPTPVMPYRFDWKVIDVNGEIYVGLEYNQSVEFRVFMEDIKRYIKDSNSIICFYRIELKENKCFKIKPIDK